MNSTTTRALGVAIALSTLAACSNDATGPAGMGTVSARVSDAGATPQIVSRQTTSAGETAAAMAGLSGHLSGSAQVLIYSDAQGWVEVGSPSDVTCGMQSSSGATVAGNAAVAAGTYTRVRLILQGFHADLDVGSVVGGVTLTSATSITLGGSDEHVQIDIDVAPFTIGADGHADIDFDLNSENWVTQETAQSESASDAAVEASTTAHVTAG